MLGATTFIFVVLLFDAAARNINIQDGPEENTAEASLWKFCKENRKTSVFFITLSIMCLVVILGGVPRSESTLDQSFENLLGLMDALYPVIAKFIVGIILPLALSDLIDSSYEGKIEMNTILI